MNVPDSCVRNVTDYHTCLHLTKTDALLKMYMFFYIYELPFAPNIALSPRVYVSIYFRIYPFIIVLRLIIQCDNASG